MKASVELAVSGIQALQLPRRGRNSYRAKASYVDETLFASHSARQPAAVDFAPPWVEKRPSPQRPLLWSPAATRLETEVGPSKAPAPPSTPRKKNKYRLKSRTPSYCDETLFSAKSGGPDGAIPWLTKDDAAKLRPLLWTPPPASRNHSSLPSRQKEKSLQAVHRETLRARQDEGVEAQYGELSFWKRAENDSEDHQDALGWAVYQPVSRVYSSASKTFQLPVSDSRTHRQQDQHLTDASVALPGSRPHSKGTPRSPSARLLRMTGSCKPRPPWK